MSGEKLINIFKRMVLIRRFEEKVAEVAEHNEIFTPVHLYVGQEAIAAAISENLFQDDYVYSTHRSHGHYLAKGGNPQKLMSEIYCRENGCSRGRGGSMHVIDRNVNFMLSSPIVGGSISIAVGSALSIKMRGERRVSVAFFGDGATDEGVFYESINFAVLYRLPMVFVCENNAFSTHLPGFARQSNPTVSERIEGFKIKTVLLDGNDPLKLYEISKELIQDVRRGHGPVLIECNTFRWLSHVGYWKDLDVGFRKKEDVLFWMNRCPIKKLSEYLLASGDLSDTDIQFIENETRTLISNCVAVSRSSKPPDPADLTRGLFSTQREGNI